MRLIFIRQSWVDRVSIWQAIGFFLLCVAVSVLIGCDSHAQDAEILQMAKDKAEELPPQAYLQFPLEYTASVTQCDTKQGCRTRFYSPRTK